jgi:hypothetical protein
MAQIKIKGYEIESKVIKTGYERMAVLFANTIIENLGKLGVKADSVDVVTNVIGNKIVPASASWYFEGRFLHFSCSKANRFIDNLYVISKVLELEVNAVLRGAKELDQFILDFTEDKDEREIKAVRSEARATLGVAENELSMEVITKKYRELAKQLHPDMPTGDLTKFKAVSVAYNTLRRELE